MMGRIDYYHQPDAPAANSIVVGSSAVVVNADGEVLLQRRADNGNWALPGGAMDVGETFADSVIREVREETGILVAVGRIIGIYSDPNHVFAYDNGEIRQQFNICCAATILGGQIAISDESTDVRFFAFDALPDLRMHPTQYIRIRDYLSNAPPVLR
jgi:8-oxo-dGTP pyrophosphatase MutT (NUDIX family)